MNFIDTHCHLNHPDYSGDLADVLLRAENAGVGLMVCAGYDLESSVQAAKLAKEVRIIHAAVGVHPHDAGTFTPGIEEQIRELASQSECVVAIGETGLDYYRSLSPRDAQQDAFRRHIDLACELDLPLIVHSRESHADVLAILKEKGVPPRGAVMHCLPADSAFAEGALELGCFLGIAGAVTFKNAETLRQIVKNLPLDRLLLETDAPYLTPHPYRGQRNEPSYLPLTAQAVADALGLGIEIVGSRTTENACRLFGFKL
jgi:TatD DNase family protein